MNPGRPALRSLNASLLLLLAACTQHVDVVSIARDASVPLCTPSAAQVPVSVEEDNPLDTLAARTLEQALCTCGDVSAADLLRVGAGDAHIDGTLRINGGAEFAGDLYVAGSGGIALGAAPLTVMGDLQVGGPVLGSTADVDIGGAALVAGRVQLRSLTVAQSLTLPGGASLELSGASDVIVHNAEVQVTPACPCGDDNRIDADAARGLPETLGLSSEEGCVVTAPAGSIETFLAMTTAEQVVIDGDLRVDGPLTVPLAAGRSLDLIVLGNISVDGPMSLGSSAGGSVRLFVTGGGTIELRQGGSLHGLLHAPDSELVLPAPLEVHGGMLVRRVAAAAALQLTR